MSPILIQSIFILFPGKKQFIKRMIAKPGDTLYFYGGEIYGIDAKGRELKELRDPEWMQKLEHIPFITIRRESQNTR